ncbi:hypothetical protein [Lysinibacter cavernae]|uniref:DUF3017 domain-containing protein n=1 Tax=Lysinibacter cavernae TaxID=1640652 RepID=A0A7X5TUW3_9MICO|nr:hypothetical protein [Lysinibacter cavernae]NIH55059.1 hypothetical protein [Lysinibacter cavernae]
MADSTVSAQIPGDSTPDSDANYWHWPRLIIVWAITIIAAAVVSLQVASSMRFEWLLFVLAGATLLTFGLQLGTAQRRGFIDRTAMSVAGSFVIVAVFSAVAVLVA